LVASLKIIEKLIRPVAVDSKPRWGYAALKGYEISTATGRIDFKK
jgi:hypothetical protein